MIIFRSVLKSFLPISLFHIVILGTKKSHRRRNFASLLFQYLKFEIKNLNKIYSNNIQQSVSKISANSKKSKTIIVEKQPLLPKNKNTCTTLNTIDNESANQPKINDVEDDTNNYYEKFRNLLPIHEISLHSLARKNGRFYKSLNFFPEQFIKKYYYIDENWRDGQFWVYDLVKTEESDLNTSQVKSSTANFFDKIQSVCQFEVTLPHLLCIFEFSFAFLVNSSRKVLKKFCL